MKQKDDLGSIILSQDEYERAMEELHKSQAPGVYSDLGEAWGWCEQPAPPYLMERIMEEIHRSREEVELNQKVMLSGGFLLLILLSSIILIAIDALNSMSPIDRNWIVTGFFWMVISLVGSGSALSLFLLRYQEKDHGSNYLDHPLEQIMKYLRLRLKR
jgi:hypothetical protein